MTRKIVADLHNHSKASDGEFTPTELVALACELGLKALALTDHDTLAGLDEFRQAGAHAGLKVIPGVEVTLRFKRSFVVGSVHLLMYIPGALLESAEFRQAVQAVLSQGRGEALVRARVEAINAEFGPEGRQPVLRCPLTAEEVMSFGVNISRRHFAQALEELHGIQGRERTLTILGNDSPAYIPSGIEMDLLRPLLKRFPVVIVLAHPAAGSFPGPSHYKEVLPPLEAVEQLLPEFLDLGIQGLEVYYPAHTPEHRELLLGWADRFGLPLVTGGSDCHDRLQRPLGVEGVGQQELDRLLARLIADGLNKE